MPNYSDCVGQHPEPDSGYEDREMSRVCPVCNGLWKEQSDPLFGSQEPAAAPETETREVTEEVDILHSL